MNNRLILYTNRNSRTAIWTYGGKMYKSSDSDTYAVMNISHGMIRDGSGGTDMAEGIKLLIEMQGWKT